MPEMPPLPAPIGHLHSNGDFCQERQSITEGWPKDVFTADAVRAYALQVAAECARIAEQVIDPVPSPLTEDSSNAARLIADLIRARFPNPAEPTS